MFKLILLSAILVCSNAQRLRLSPLIIGSNQAAEIQEIQLAAGGGLGPGLRYARAPQLLARPIAIQAAPIATLAAPAPLLTRQVLAAPLIDESPEPYTYAFQSVDEFGTALNRQESSDASGVVTGSYGYTDAQGLQRIVEYIADAGGFRASVKTNEPGTANANPADVIIQSTANRRR
jgi:hypothetical protein